MIALAAVVADPAIRFLLVETQMQHQSLAQGFGVHGMRVMHDDEWW